MNSKKNSCHGNYMRKYGTSKSGQIGQFFDQQKPNAMSGILSVYFSQNICSDDLRTTLKSNWRAKKNAK